LLLVVVEVVHLVRVEQADLELAQAHLLLLAQITQSPLVLVVVAQTAEELTAIQVLLLVALLHLHLHHREWCRQAAERVALVLTGHLPGATAALVVGVLMAVTTEGMVILQQRLLKVGTVRLRLPDKEIMVEQDSLPVLRM